MMRFFLTARARVVVARDIRTRAMHLMLDVRCWGAGVAFVPIGGCIAFPAPNTRD